MPDDDLRGARDNLVSENAVLGTLTERKTQGLKKDTIANLTKLIREP